MISTQYIKLNMTPSGVLPVLYCSQYDIGRPLGLVVYNGNVPVDLDTYTATIEATRTDGTPITAAVTTDDNIGVFVTTAEMTNKKDKYLAKLVLVDSSTNRVASLAFVMVITHATMDENAQPIQEDRSLYQQYTAAVQALIAEIHEDIAELQDVKVQRYDTAAQMKADTALKVGMYARTGGYYAVNDGGEALYRIYSTAPSTHYETLTNSLYAELIVENRTVTPNLFGAYGDGTHDDTAAVRSALKYSIDKGEKLLLIGKYYITGSLLTSSDYSSARVNIEGARPLKRSTYLVEGNDTGIIFDNGLNIFDGLTISGSISRVAFTPLSRTQTGSIFKNCTLSGLVFQECMVANILAFCYNTAVRAICKFNENHFLSLSYFAKCETSYACIDSYICKNYINGNGAAESHCFEWSTFTGSNVSTNTIDFFQTIYYPKVNTASSFIGPNSVGNTFQVFRYFYFKTTNISVMYINSVADNFAIMDADALTGDTYAATKAILENYTVYTYSVTVSGTTYTDNLKPYIMFVNSQTQVSIKNATTGLYTKNLVYLADSITSYKYAKAELSINIYYYATYRDYDDCVQHFSGGFYNGGSYKFNTIHIPFIKEYAELPSVSNFAQSDYYMGEKIKVGNKIYRLYALEASWLHPAWFDISALV